MFGCNHKYGEVKGRYQYCEKCGKAIIAPCLHKWVKIDKIESSYLVAGNVNEIIYVNRCSLCGVIEKIIIS